MSGEADKAQDLRINENREELKAHQKRIGKLEKEQAVLSAGLSSLHGTMETGFADVKDVIKARIEADEKREERRHDLAVQTAKDTQIWWGKAFGILATLLTMAGGGGGAYYALTDKAEPVAPVAAPVAP